MGKLIAFPCPLSRAAITYDRETVRIAHVASVEWAAASLRHALGRGIYTEIADAESELREAVERWSANV